MKCILGAKYYMICVKNLLIKGLKHKFNRTYYVALHIDKSGHTETCYVGYTKNVDVFINFERKSHTIVSWLPNGNGQYISRMFTTPMIGYEFGVFNENLIWSWHIISIDLLVDGSTYCALKFKKNRPLGIRNVQHCIGIKHIANIFDSSELVDCMRKYGIHVYD